ncbi:MAG: chloride channel protein [Hallerella porci]|uniref:chloride channel protein n=1 Tax=Hallerella TaxID=2815788 RepID=UPI000D07B21D|nr:MULTISPECIES: chloride channel protein [Hallerella]MCI5601473.1 chloride channel protein [Hallerella sp.]MDY3922490.1 chloride channel protein [Hallerella porci]
MKKISRLFIINSYMPKMFLAAFIGLVTGGVAIIFRICLESTTEFVNKTFSGPFLFLAPAIGGLLVGLLLFVFAKTPEAAGQGTDRSIYAFHHRGGVLRKRVAPVKLLASTITLGSGGSAGFEGPVSQIGSGIASTICRFFKMTRAVRRQFGLAGMAAGLGSIFKAPLAGALTSVEILYREDFESSAFGTSIIASVVGFTVYSSVFGTAPTFNVPDFYFVNSLNLFCCALLGLLCVPASYLYVKFYYKVEDFFTAWKIPNWAKPAIGGILCGAVAFFFPQAMGGTWDYVESMTRLVDPEHSPSILFLLGLVIAKIMATSFTVGSGGAGGVFGPSLFLGGVLGAAFAVAFETVLPGVLQEPGAMALVGMGAFFAGAAKAPLAGVVMVCEMTGSYQLLPGIMLAAVVHVAFSRKWGIYRSQVLNKFSSPAHRLEMDPDLLRTISVGSVMQKSKVLCLDAKKTIHEAEKDIDTFNVEFTDSATMHTYPVFDGEEYLGVLDWSLVLRNIVSIEGGANVLLVSDCVTHSPLLPASVDLHSAMKFMLKHSINEVYVKNSAGKIVGTISSATILHAYDKAVKNEK